MYGKTVYREIKSLRPQIPVILMSGYDEEIALRGLAIESSDEFIQKPFGIAPLMERVQRRIERSGNGTWTG